MSGPGGVAGDQLRALVERIEHVEEEIKALTEDKKDIYAEAKGQGLRLSMNVSRSAGSGRCAFVPTAPVVSAAPRKPNR